MFRDKILKNRPEATANRQLRLEQAFGLPQDSYLVHWQLTDMCNYHCSYCPLGYHQGLYGFPDIEKVKAGIDLILHQQNSKQVAFFFTGGEITLWPQLTDLLSFCKERNVRTGLHTNGSSSLEWWEMAVPYLDLIRFTYHAEEALSDEFIHKIEMLAGTTSIIVDVPVQPEWFDNSLLLAQELGSLRSVTPVLQPLFVESFSTLATYTNTQWKSLCKENTHFTEASLMHENSGLAARCLAPLLSNTMFDSGECKSVTQAEILANDWYHFDGWECYAPVEQLSIDVEGETWVGQCREAACGNIYQGTCKLPATPIICSKEACTYTADLFTKKNRTISAGVAMQPRSKRQQRIDHAPPENKDVFVINWNITSVCNYRCSYCPDSLHSGKIRFPSKKQIFNFCRYIRQVKGEQKVLIEFTGGEVTLWPELPEVLAHLKHHGFFTNFLSNGSKPASWWIKHSHAFQQVTLTFHAERADKQEFIENIQILRGKVYLVINVIMKPEIFDDCLRAAQDFSAIAGTIVNLQPIIIDFKDKLADYTEQQLIVIKNHQDYLSPVTPVESGKTLPSFRGVLRYTEDGEEFAFMSPQDFISHDKNHWAGWDCYAGIEQIAIDSSGHIWRGWCFEGSLLGDIYQNRYELPERPIRCTKATCHCNFDIMCTKEKAI